MDQAWLEAAHSYNRMTDAQRYDYWNRLSPEQQSALAAALEAVRDQAPAAPVVVSTPVTVASSPEVGPGPATASPIVRQTARRQPGGRTLAGTLGIGCVGMILGILVTLAVEAALISAGVNFLAELFDSGTTPSSSSRSSRPSEPPSPDTSTSRDDSPRERSQGTAPNCPRTEQEWAECSIEWQKRK